MGEIIRPWINKHQSVRYAPSKFLPAWEACLLWLIPEEAADATSLSHSRSEDAPAVALKADECAQATETMQRNRENLLYLPIWDGICRGAAAVEEMAFAIDGGALDGGIGRSGLCVSSTRSCLKALVPGNTVRTIKWRTFFGQTVEISSVRSSAAAPGTSLAWSSREFS